MADPATAQQKPETLWQLMLAANNPFDARSWKQGTLPRAQNVLATELQNYSQPKNPVSQALNGFAVDMAQKIVDATQKKATTAQAALTAGTDKQKLDAQQQLAALGVPVTAGTDKPAATISFDLGSPITPAQSSSPFDFGNFSNTIEGIESGHQAGVSGPATKYGTAHGSMQVLDSTGEATAKKYGIPWDAKKMSGTDADSLAYQRQIGGLVLQDALVQAGGDPVLAAKIYHGGPDQSLWGPQTEAYAAKVAQALNLTGTQQGVHGYSALDPARAGLIPNPQPVESKLLPLAPALEAPAAQAQLPQMDKSVIQPLLDAYAAQGQVTPNDQALARKATNREAINEALTYGLVGALGGGIPGLLAGGAFGYLQGGNHGKQAAIAGRQAAADSARQNLINAALQEVAMNKDNFTIGNQNLDRAVQTAQGQIDTRNTNKMNTDQRAMQQVQQDQGVDQFNTNAQNQANLVRAQTQLGLEQGVVQAQNLTGDKQDKYALAGLTAGNTPVVNSLLQSIGVSPQKKPGQPEESGVELARQAAQYISVNNVPGAFGTLAQEIVDKGAGEQILQQAPAELKAYQDAIKAKDKAKAANIIAQLMANDPSTAKQIADVFATQGYPVATLISKNAKVQ